MSATADSTLADPQELITDLQRQLAASNAERDEALARETATAEVVQVINSSSGDLAPVFDAILEKAMRLCEAALGHLWIYDGERAHPAAVRGEPKLVEWMRRIGSVGPFRSARPSPLGRVVQGEPLVHVADAREEEAYRSNPVYREQLDVGGIRTLLEIGMRKGDAPLGVIALYRLEVRPFTDKQIALLQNFAAQAVIAMENARLITETREALEQQTATAEVLGVINSSPGDLAPVFDAMLEKATALCDAPLGTLWLFDGEHINPMATRGASPELSEFLAGPRPPNPVQQRQLRGEGTIHMTDLKATALYRDGDTLARAVADLGGIQTVLSVPLRRENRVLGLFGVYRQEIRPFSDKQIALIENFAAQAVIAIENARLITETREALEQQTATAELLQVINSSPGELAPVFDAALEKAMSVCDAAFGTLWSYDGEYFRLTALRGVPPAFGEYLRRMTPEQGTTPTHARILAGQRIAHIEDAAADEAHLAGNPQRRALVELGGAHTLLSVPLLKDEAVLGVFTIYRQEVRAFSNRQITSLQNFAAQAVIAMENARLLGDLRQRTTDLQESLEYQTATSDVLKLISRSTFDLQPVLDALTETAARLCLAEQAYMTRREGDAYRFVSAGGATPETTANAARFKEEVLDRRTFVAGRGTITGRVLSEGRPVQIIDAAADPEYTLSEIVTVAKIRTIIGIPLIRGDEPIGTFNLARQRVEPFTERQIELVRTFADQAVIAIENTRLLTELRESLEQQQAIADILQVINGSPGDLQPVFDILLEKAMQLCGAAFGVLAVLDGEQTRTVAAQGLPPVLAEWRRNHPVISPRNTLLARVVAGEPYVHTLDLKDDDLYRRGEPLRRANVDLGRARSSLYVPLLRDREVLGTIHIYRQEVRPFTEKQIALLQSFASQAVIAMDNARLLNEIRQRQAELRVTFDNMGDGVAMFDVDLRLAAWNLNFQRILQIPDALLSTRPNVAEFVRYLATHGEYGQVDVEAEVRRLSEAVGTQWSTERIRPDGKVIEVRNNPVPGGGFVLIYSDVTERKRAEAEIRKARDAAETALRELQTTQASLVHAQKMAALGQLTAGIAHEIKNPLNFVNNFAGLSVELLDDLKEAAAPGIATLDEDTRAEIDETVKLLTGNLEKIAEHGKRADGIVKSMLEHSRGGSGDWRAVDLNGLIDEALNLAYHGARAQDQSFNITMQREFDRDLAPIQVVPQDITRVFLNLFSNGFYAASKREREAATEFRPVLTVSTRDLEDQVEIRVRDNGVGIAPEIRGKLFQPFVTTKPTGEGTGLGLSISYDIVTQQHGGKIEVDSGEGAFTEFIVRLPRRQAPSATVRTQ